MDKMLHQLADSISSARTLEDLARPLLEMLEAVTGMESTYLTTIDLAGGIQHVLFARNSRQLQIPEGLSVPWSDTLCKRALEEGVPYTDDVAGRWGDSEAARELGLATYLSTPVCTEDGVLHGTLCAASAARLPMPPSAERVLAMFSRLIGQHLEREQLLAALQQANSELATHAMTDPVTRLPNRRCMLQELSRMLGRARRDGTAVVVAFIDLDGFKHVNDTYGHEAGDRLLAAVGERLCSGRRAGDLVARYGGDEFVMAAPVAREQFHRSVLALRERLSLRTRGRYDLGDLLIDYAGASVGIVASTGDGDSAEDLVSRADEAMYEHKRERRALMAA